MSSALLGEGTKASQLDEAKQHVIQLPGHPTKKFFTLGGRKGNIVTGTSDRSVQKGWRAIEINSIEIPEGEAGATYTVAHKLGNHTVTFVDPLGREGRLKEMAAEKMRRAVEEKAKREKEAKAKREAAENSKTEKEERLRREATKNAERKAAEEQARVDAEVAANKKERAQAAAKSAAEAQVVKDRAKATAAKASAAAVCALTALSIILSRAVRDAEAVARKRKEKKDEKSRKMKDVELAGKATKAAANASKIATGKSRRQENKKSSSILFRITYSRTHTQMQLRPLNTEVARLQKGWHRPRKGRSRRRKQKRTMKKRTTPKKQRHRQKPLPLPLLYPRQANHLQRR